MELSYPPAVLVWLNHVQYLNLNVLSENISNKIQSISNVYDSSAVDRFRLHANAAWTEREYVYHHTLMKQDLRKHDLFGVHTLHYYFESDYKNRNAIFQ